MPLHRDRGGAAELYLPLQRNRDCSKIGRRPLRRRYTATNFLVGEASDWLQALLPLQRDKEESWPLSATASRLIVAL